MKTNDEIMYGVKINDTVKVTNRGLCSMLTRLGVLKLDLGPVQTREPIVLWVGLNIYHSKQGVD